MTNVNSNSGSFKHIGRDTRNNWVTMMFVTKCRYNCFKKQSHIDTCTAAFKELESLGFEFGTFGFGGNHTHFLCNVPKKYSIAEAEGILKSRSARRMFEKHLGFRKRYPRNEFWSGYEHHESTGRKDYAASEGYILNQQKHHNIVVVDDTQRHLHAYTADRDTARPSEARA